MPVTNPPSDAATIDKLTQAKAAVDAYFLAEQILVTWQKIQKQLLVAATAAKRILAEGADPAVASHTLIEIGTTLDEQLDAYTNASNRAAADLALITQVGGLTQERIDAAVTHLEHGISQMKSTPKDGSEADALATMLLTFYSEPAKL